MLAGPCQPLQAARAAGFDFGPHGNGSAAGDSCWSVQLSWTPQGAGEVGGLAGRQHARLLTPGFRPTPAGAAQQRTQGRCRMGVAWRLPVSGTRLVPAARRQPGRGRKQLIVGSGLNCVGSCSSFTAAAATHRACALHPGIAMLHIAVLCVQQSCIGLVPFCCVPCMQVVAFLPQAAQLPAFWDIPPITAVRSDGSIRLVGEGVPPRTPWGPLGGGGVEAGGLPARHPPRPPAGCRGDRSWVLHGWPWECASRSASSTATAAPWRW